MSNTFYRGNFRIVIGILATLLIPFLGAGILLYAMGLNPVGYVVAVILVATPIYIMFASRRPRLEAFPARLVVDPEALKAERIRYDGIRFGPNGHVVVEFLSRLPALSQDHWKYAESVERGMRPSLAGALVRIFRKSSNSENRGQPSPRDAEAEAALYQALAEFRENGGPSSSPQMLDMIRAAGFALIYRDVFSPSRFNQLYGPFAALIPIDVLTSGSENGRATVQE